MNQIQTIFKLLSLIALLALPTGCASTKSRESNLVAAGFKTITPSTPAQQAKLQAMPTDKVTTVQKDGKTYYVFPDKAHNQAYVGGPKQMDAYKERLAQQKQANENLELSQDSETGWGAWAGWDGPGWGTWQ